MYLQEWVWHQKQTTGPAPLGVRHCAFTVVGKRLIVYGGYCCHSGCYHNSLHELNAPSLEWTVLAPNVTERAPMQKISCGIAVRNTEDVYVVGGYGLLSTGTHPTAQYKEMPEMDDDIGFTNELHLFSSSEQKSLCCLKFSA